MVNQTEYLNGKSTKEQDFNRNRKCNMRDTACSMSDISFSLIGKKKILISLWGTIGQLNIGYLVSRDGHVAHC